MVRLWRGPPRRATVAWILLLTVVGNAVDSDGPVGVGGRRKVRLRCFPIPQPLMAPFGVQAGRPESGAAPSSGRRRFVRRVIVLGGLATGAFAVALISGSSHASAASPHQPPATGAISGALGQVVASATSSPTPVRMLVSHPAERVAMTATKATNVVERGSRTTTMIVAKTTNDVAKSSIVTASPSARALTQAGGNVDRKPPYEQGKLRSK